MHMKVFRQREEVMSPSVTRIDGVSASSSAAKWRIKRLLRRRLQYGGVSRRAGSMAAGMDSSSIWDNTTWVSVVSVYIYDRTTASAVFVDSLWFKDLEAACFLPKQPECWPGKVISDV